MLCPKCQQKLERVGKFWVCPSHGQIDERPMSSEGSPTGKAKRVFISYGRADALEFVRRLSADLKGRGGHDVWIDLESIEKGGMFEVRIERGIRRSDVFAAVMTPRSVEDDSVCRDEVVFALNEGKKVVPIRVDSNAKPTLLLARRNWVDFTEKYETALDALLRYLAGDEAALLPPRLPTITGIAPIDFGVEIAKFYTGFAGRQWLRGEVDQWLKSGTKRAFIIVGEPGVGKSSIAAWMSQTYKNVVGIHFCTQQNTRSLKPYEFVASLVGQLHSRLPGFDEKVEAQHPEVRRPKAADAFRELIIDPARHLAKPAELQLIIVDSLDEAASEPGDETVLDVLVQQAPSLPDWLRIVMTTRPEEHILRRIKTLKVFELATERAENREDLREFIDDRLRSAPMSELVGSEH